MRNSLILLIFLGFLGCARFQQAAAPAVPSPTNASAQAQVTDATTANATPANATPANVAPASVECSDGTAAPSLAACLNNMARARLPSSQQVESNPAGAAR
jgi:hypothetical protein